MTVGSGLSSQLVIVQETTWGTTPSLATAKAFEFNKETLKLNKKVIQSKGLHAGGQSLRASRRAVVSRQAGGDVEMDCPIDYLGVILMACLGSWGTVPTQIATSGAYKGVHQRGPMSGATAKSLSIQKGAPEISSTVDAYTYNGCRVTSWEFNAKVDEFLGLKFTVDAQDERSTSSTPVAGPALATAAYSANETGMFHFAEGTLLSGGTLSQASGVWSVTGNAAEANVTEFTLKSTNPMATDRIFLNTSGLKQEQIDNDFFATTGTMKQEYSSVAQYERFRNDTELVLVLKFLGPVIGTGGEQATLEFLMTGVRLNGDSPMISGPDIVEIGGDFDLLDPVGAAPDLQVTYISKDVTY
jgi:hypothetical protein